jgi:aryl-alcohol dehydrogenase-like predicted oxidoreductase
MKLRSLGKTGIRLSEVGFGAWAIGGAADLFGIPVGWSGVNDADSLAALQRSRELGVNFFDTADVYGGGHSEELIGQELAGQDCVIASKVGNARGTDRAFKDFSEGHIRTSLEGSLKRLRRDVIDIYQLHNPPQDVWRKDEVFTLLQTLKKEGMIRAAGVSISTIEEGIHLVESRKVDCLQVLFNILNQEPASRLLPLAEKRGVGIIVRVPLASGLLSGKYTADQRFPADDNRRNYLTGPRVAEAVGKVEELKRLTVDSGLALPKVALSFVLQFSGVSSVIPGARNREQAEQNAGASGIVLDDAIFRAIRERFGETNFFIRHKVRI